LPLLSSHDHWNYYKALSYLLQLEYLS
jgi:hypothetical protein